MESAKARLDEIEKKADGPGELVQVSDTKKGYHVPASDDICGGSEKARAHAGGERRETKDMPVAKNLTGTVL